MCCAVYNKNKDVIKKAVDIYLAEYRVVGRQCRDGAKGLLESLYMDSFKECIMRKGNKTV